MFKNMKLSVKLAFGFGSIVLVVILLGVTSYVMFSRVNTNIAKLNNQNLPVVQHISALEGATAEAVEQEKNYIIYENDEMHKEFQIKVAKMLSALDEVDKVANQFNDTELKSKSKDIRDSTGQVDQLFGNAVAILKDNKDKGEIMSTKGKDVSDVACEYLTAKKTEFANGQNALAIINNFDSFQLEMRLNMVSYWLRNDQKNFDAVEKLNSKIIDCCDKLTAMNLNTVEQKQIREARKAAEGYLENASAWFKEHKRDAASVNLAKLNQQLVQTGRVLTNTAAEYRSAKESEVNTITKSVFLANAMGQTAYRMRLREKEYTNKPNEKTWNELLMHKDLLCVCLNDLRKVSLTNEDNLEIANAEKSVEDYLVATKGWLENNTNVSKTIFPKLKAKIEELGSKSLAARNDAWKKADECSADVTSIVASSKVVIITSLIAGIVFGILLAFIITRSIVGPITRIILGLTEGSEQVASASGQVSAASQSLAEGATEQAAGLEETSSSLEEMASMTKQNADNAQQANTLAAEARKAADTGNESMGKMNTAIQDIQKSSDETAKIIKVIDEIAFQTNLLALNAAVEAARAGEAGKGFAVVAEEVRNLAMRSAEAAKDTSAMIEESVKNSHNGVEIAGEVSKILEQVVEGIGKTTDLVGEIAAASQEQSQGIDQVNTAVNQMDKVTQSNAANAEESASASEELSAQAEQMNGIVEELSALVGGSNGNTKSATSSSRQALKTSDHAFHQIAGGTSQVPVTQNTAEKSIPLGSQGDFEGFNK